MESGQERVAIITGAGKAFCAGMDLDALKALATQSPEQNLADARRTAAFFRRLWSFPKPLIAAVNGAALGRGCGIATLCDFTFAVPEAKFGYTEVRIGFIPALVSDFPGKAGGREVGARSFSYRPDSGRCRSESDGPGHENRAGSKNSSSAAREWPSTLMANSPGAMQATKRLLVRAERSRNRPPNRTGGCRKRGHSQHSRLPRRALRIPRKTPAPLVRRIMT